MGLVAPLAEASDSVNELTKEKLLAQVRKHASPGDSVAILGMSYKPDTYIVEESAGLYLGQNLHGLGYKVYIHDYAAAPSNSPSLHEFLALEDPKAIVARNDIKVAVVCCPWPQYRSLQFGPGTLVISPWKLHAPGQAS